MLLDFSAFVHRNAFNFNMRTVRSRSNPVHPRLQPALFRWGPLDAQKKEVPTVASFLCSDLLLQRSPPKERRLQPGVDRVLQTYMFYMYMYMLHVHVHLLQPVLGPGSNSRPPPSTLPHASGLQAAEMDSRLGGALAFAAEVVVLTLDGTQSEAQVDAP